MLPEDSLLPEPSYRIPATRSLRLVLPLPRVPEWIPTLPQQESLICEPEYARSNFFTRTPFNNNEQERNRTFLYHSYSRFLVGTRFRRSFRQTTDYPGVSRSPTHLAKRHWLHQARRGRQYHRPRNAVLIWGSLFCQPFELLRTAAPAARGSGSHGSHCIGPSGLSCQKACARQATAGAVHADDGTPRQIATEAQQGR